MRNGWQTKTIGEVCEFQRGLTYAKGDEVDASDNVVLRATNVDLATNLLVFDELKYINDNVVVPESKKVKKGSLLICTASGSKSHLGKVAYIDEDYGYAFGGFMGMLTPLNGLSPRYLFHLMTSENYKDFIGALSDGANINNLTFDNLRRFPVPVPPLAEQHRIVAILDEAFEGIATAKTNAEKNVENARAIFESYLQSIFDQGGPGWVEKKLEEIGKTQTGATPKTNDRSNYGDFISFVKPGDFNPDGSLDYDKDGLSESGASNARIVPADSVLMVCIGATIGKCGYCDRDVTTNQQVNALTPSDGSSSRFLYYQMLTETFQRKVIYASGQATLPIINKSKWSALSVWLPQGVAEQEKIAEKCDVLVEETRRLAHLYARKIATLETMKQSILHQAFTGNI
ncbi:MAG: restriction endonuclease subunit S [bacterium]|nr:restriction endonuclease subunit S [bacterium]